MAELWPFIQPLVATNSINPQVLSNVLAVLMHYSLAFGFIKSVDSVVHVYNLFNQYFVVAIQLQLLIVANYNNNMIENNKLYYKVACTSVFCKSN